MGHVVVGVEGRWERILGSREFSAVLTEGKSWAGRLQSALLKGHQGLLGVPNHPSCVRKGVNTHCPGDAWGVSSSLGIWGWDLPWDLGWGETNPAHVSSTVTEVLVSELGQHEVLAKGVCGTAGVSPRSSSST